MRVICFGDSVTRGVSFVSGRMRILKENYPALLSSALGSLGIEVVNKGVFNDNSDLLVNRLESDVLSQNPDYVFIEIGGNDCNFHWGEVAERPDEEHQPIVPLDRYLLNVETMVQEIRKSGSTPVILSILPLDPVRYYAHIASQYGNSISHWIASCGGIAHWHGLYNRSLSSLVRSLEVMTVDLRTAFKKAADLAVLLSDDGIHPTGEGYQAMSRVLEPFLMSRLTEGTRA